jgi:hypothetical protein
MHVGCLSLIGGGAVDVFVGDWHFQKFMVKSYSL